MSLSIYYNLDSSNSLEFFNLTNSRGGTFGISSCTAKKAIIVSFIEFDTSNDWVWLGNLISIYSTYGSASNAIIVPIVYRNSGGITTFQISQKLTTYGYTLPGGATDFPLCIDSADGANANAVAKNYKKGFAPSDPITIPFVFILYCDGTNFRVVDKFHMGSTQNGDGLRLNAAGTAPTLAEAETFITSRIADHLDDTPVIDSTDPADGTLLRTLNTININFSEHVVSTEATAAANYTLTDNNSNPIAKTVSYANKVATIAFTGGTPTDGDVELSIAGIHDSAGNALTGTTAFSLTVDATAPVKPSVTGAAHTRDTTPSWSWSSGGGGNGTFRYKLDDPNLEAGATVTPDTGYTPADALSEGTHTLYVQERDSAGNWSVSGYFTIDVDITAPGAPAVTGPARAGSQQPTWSWTSGGGGGNGTYRYKVDSNDFSSGATQTENTGYTPPSNLSEGDHWLYAQERDDAGNWSASGSFKITIDITGPNPPDVTGPDTTCDTTPTWSWTSGGNGGIGSYRFKVNSADLSSGATLTSSTEYTPAALAAGTYTLYVQESDDLGNWSTSGTHAIVIDLDAPDAPDVSGDVITNNKRPTWTWTQDADKPGNGTFRYKFGASGEPDMTDAVQTTLTSYTPVSDLGEGEHTLYVEERDDAGNWSQSGHFTVEIDITAPDAPSVTNVTATPTNNKKPTWRIASSASNPGNGTFRFRLDNPDLTTGTTQVSGSPYDFTPGSDLSGGSHILYAEERDDAGNWSPPGFREIIVDIDAPDAPDVTVSIPAGETQPVWNWTSGGGGGNGTYRYRFNDSDVEGSPSAETEDTSYHHDTDLTSASYTLYVQERDEAGNWSLSGSATILVDLEGPEIQSATINEANTVITVEFNKNVYANNDGTGDLQTEDFDLDFSPNGGDASVSYGSAIHTAGTSKVYIPATVTGLAAGCETITITPKSGQVFDYTHNDAELTPVDVTLNGVAREAFLVLDCSGTMGDTVDITVEGGATESRYKIDLLGEAIREFVSIWGHQVTVELHQNDKIGMVKFRSEIDEAAELMELTSLLNNFETMNTTHFTGIIASGCTAMGAGLTYAINRLNYSPGDFSAKKRVILVTDGMQNRNPLVYKADPANINSTILIDNIVPENYPEGLGSLCGTFMGPFNPFDPFPDPLPGGDGGDSNYAGTLPCTVYSAALGPDGNVPVYTIGMGDHESWQEMLTDISARTDALHYEGEDMWPGLGANLTNILVGIFAGNTLQIVKRSGGTLSAGEQKDTLDFVLNRSAKRLTVSLTWQGNTPLTFALKKGTHTITRFDMVTDDARMKVATIELPYVLKHLRGGLADIIKKKERYSKETFYAAALFEKPEFAGISGIMAETVEPEGSWSVEITRAYDGRSKSVNSVPYHITALADEENMEFEFECPPFCHTGDRIALGVKAFENGIPVSTLTSVDIKISKPAKSAAEIINKYSRIFSDKKIIPQHDISSSPFADRIKILLENKTAVSELRKKTADTMRLSPVKQTVRNNIRNVPEYSGYYTKALVPGVYKVRFIIKGSTAKSGVFQREAERTIVVKPKADIKQTKISAAIYEKENKAVITIMPKDRYGNIMGPGNSLKIACCFNRKRITGIKDNFDGNYTVVLPLKNIKDPRKAEALIKISHDKIFSGILADLLSGKPARERAVNKAKPVKRVDKKKK